MFSLQFLASGSWDRGALQLNSPLRPHRPQAVFRKLLKFIYCAFFCFCFFLRTHRAHLTGRVTLLCSERWLPSGHRCHIRWAFHLAGSAGCFDRGCCSASTSGQVRLWVNRWSRLGKSIEPSHPLITPQGAISADWWQPAPSSLWLTPRDGTLPALSSTSSVFLSHPA